MCNVTISINEAAVRKINPSLSSLDAIQQWLQHQVNIMMENLAEAKEPPCSYTEEEVRHLVTDRLDRYDAGLAKTVSLEEVEKHMKARLA